MEGIRSWGVSVCVVSLICALVQMILPNDSVGKMVKILLAVLFLCCFISPIANLKGNMSLNIPKNNNQELSLNNSKKLTERTDRQLKLQIQKQLAEIVGKVITEYNVKAKNILIIMDTDGNNRISINQINVVLYEKDKEKGEAIAGKIYEQLKTKVDISYV